MKKVLWNNDWLFENQKGKSCRITLPHDAMQVEGRAADAPSGNSGAHYLGGIYTYSKQFELTKQEVSGNVQVQFDGVYRNTIVFVNGLKCKEVRYGYLPFWVDITDFVQTGINNITVEADNSEQPNSRWYTGSGIYRSVWLWTGNQYKIEPCGIHITTKSINPAVITVNVVHNGDSAEVEIWDGDHLIIKKTGDDLELELPEAKLWSDETPYLYRCHVILRKDGIVIDEADQAFGVRLLHYDTTGLYVNGKRTLLKGGCLHHDNGILGALSLPEAEERRLRIMKESGFNAIRCAHNPASGDLLDVCDKLGIYVMEEMWDMWYQRKNKYDYGHDFPQYWREDVETVVKRDQPHPSVIMYSIGNEVTEPYEEKGVELGKKIVKLFHELDDTRPTTVGLNMALLAMSAMGMGLYDKVDEQTEEMAPAVNSTVFNETVSRNNQLVMASCREDVDKLSTPILDAVDIAGYNYAAPRYPLDAEQHPGRISVGSETFPHHLAATWKEMKNCPYIIGDFMWAAWDYLGECSLGAWTDEEDGLAFNKPYPWKLADEGAFDLLGNPTGEALWAAAVWRNKTSIGVRPVRSVDNTLAKGAWRGTNAIPSWSWSGCEGKEAIVEVYTQGKTVILFLNGEQVGSSDTTDMRAIFTIIYQPGQIEAVAYDENGRECGRSSLSSAKNEVHWKIDSESETLHPGQTAYFSVTLVDMDGVVESNADEMLSLKVDGGELLGFGSAAPRTEAEFTDGIYPSRYGRALAAVRIQNEKKLILTLQSKRGVVDYYEFGVEEGEHVRNKEISEL